MTPCVERSAAARRCSGMNLRANTTVIGDGGGGCVGDGGASIVTPSLGSFWAETVGSPQMRARVEGFGGLK